MEITRIFGREILDSRGNPTVEGDVLSPQDKDGSRVCPFGALSGEYERGEGRNGAHPQMQSVDIGQRTL